MSSCVSTEFTRKMKNQLSKAGLKKNLRISPNQSMIMNSSTQLLNSSPSIPNGFAFGTSSGKCDNKGALAKDTSSRFAKVGIPAIPSRFLTPILKFDTHEKDQGYELFDTIIGTNQDEGDQILVAKIARLTNEGKQVGPGSYNP